MLRNFTKKFTNLVLSSYFITRLFNQANSNENKASLELSFLADMSALNSKSN